jgi:ribonuclease P protein component
VVSQSGRTGLVTLRKRAEFLAIRGGAKWATPGFVLEAKARARSDCADPTPRFGFTVTKRLGTAVVRNRIRRRLREALRTGPITAARLGFDYAVIARQAALTRAFADLAADFRLALAKVHGKGGKGASQAAARS